MRTTPRFITFEGPEGAGKSTHIALAADALRRRGVRVVVTRQPGGSRLSAAFRRLLLDGGEGMTPLAELFLYEADRAQHMDDVIRPALKRGQWVLCDRFTDSTLAYQGAGRGLDQATIRALNQIASGGMEPDLTVLIDVPVRRGLALARQAKRKHDRLERAGLAFHERVRRGFLALARQHPRRFRVVRQQPDVDSTQALVQAALSRLLP